jgi:peptidoglycan/xylan/chitin deacetylase (PgdA/CDA1 family)
MGEERHTVDQVAEEVYQELYTQSQKDFRRIQLRGFFRKSFHLILTLLAVSGILAALAYLTFIRTHLQKLSSEINRYTDELTYLNTEIQKLTASERFYRSQIDEFQSVFDNLIIEDSRLIDVDLTKVVMQNVESFEAGRHEYYNISRGNTDFSETALTFDLGTGEDLPAVYAILNRFEARATVFISNEMASTQHGSLFRDRNIHYLKKLHELGCEIGNHTWSHYNLKRSIYETSRKRRLHISFISNEVMDEFSLILEFDLVRRHFKQETGLELSPVWRAPYGAIDHRILSTAAKAGYPYHIFWSGNEVGPLDFFDYEKKRTVRIYDNNRNKYAFVRNPNYYTSGEMLSRMKEWEQSDEHGLNGAIAIAHLGTSRKMDKMIKILPEYISYFQQKGYRFVTVSEMLNDRMDI